MNPLEGAHLALFLGIPTAVLLLTSSYIVLQTVLGGRLRLFGYRGPAVEVRSIDTTKAGIGDLPQEIRRSVSERFVLAENWIDRPWFLGKLLGPLAWVYFGFATMLAVNAALLFVERNPSWIPSMMAKTVCITLIPIVLLYCKRLLAEWLDNLLDFVERGPREVVEWFAGYIRRVFLARSTSLWGLVVGVVIVAFEYQDGAFGQRNSWVRMIVVLASLAMTSLAGIALTIMVKGAILIGAVGRQPIYVSPSPYGVLSTGRMLVRAFGAVTVIYVLALSTMILRAMALQTQSRQMGLILVWAVFVAGVYLAMFLLPQWAIHSSMVEFKRRRLSETERHLRMKLDEFDRAPAKSVHETIEALRRRRDELQSLPEWPFNWKNFTGILSLAVSSALATILDVLKPGLTAWLIPAK